MGMVHRHHIRDQRQCAGITCIIRHHIQPAMAADQETGMRYVMNAHIVRDDRPQTCRNHIFNSRGGFCHRLAMTGPTLLRLRATRQKNNKNK